MVDIKLEIAAIAARIVVEEGLDWGAAKRRAVKQLGLPMRSPLPDNSMLEGQIEEYIALFCADSQALELKALRELAMTWMTRLTEFRPYLSGAVWHGTATRHSDVYLDLYCEDPKAAEIFLINKGVQFEAREVTSTLGAKAEALSVHCWCEPFRSYIGLHLFLHDLDDLRGSLQRDARGRSPRGDLEAVRALMHDDGPYAK